MTRPIPPSLKIVAYLFIAFGLHAVFDVIIALLSGRIKIQLGVLQIFIGYGLLRLNPNSFKWAMVATWFWLIATPIMAVLFLFNAGNLKILGRTVGQAPYGLGFIISVAMFGLAYWQYSVLNSREVRQAFGPPAPQAPALNFP